MLIRDLWGLAFGGRERDTLQDRLGVRGNTQRGWRGRKGPVPAWWLFQCTCPTGPAPHRGPKQPPRPHPLAMDQLKRQSYTREEEGKSLSLPVLASCCLCQSHRVHFALALEELFITLVHIVFIPVKACRKLAHQSPRSTPFP